MEPTVFVNFAVNLFRITVWKLFLMPPAVLPVKRKTKIKSGGKALKQPRTQLKTAPAYFIMLLILVLDQLTKTWCE